MVRHRGGHLQQKQESEAESKCLPQPQFPCWEALGHTSSVSNPEYVSGQEDFTLKIF